MSPEVFNAYGFSCSFNVVANRYKIYDVILFGVTHFLYLLIFTDYVHGTISFLLSCESCVPLPLCRVNKALGQSIIVPIIAYQCLNSSLHYTVSHSHRPQGEMLLLIKGQRRLAQANDGNKCAVAKKDSTRVKTHIIDYIHV